MKPTEQEVKESRNQWSDHVTKQFGCSCLTLMKEHEGALHQFGTGIILGIGKHAFILTASHVVTELNKVKGKVLTQLGLPSKGKETVIRPLPKIIRVLNSPEKLRDQMDVCVIEIPLASLGTAKPLSIHDVDLNHKSTDYLLIGLPIKQLKHRSTKKEPRTTVHSYDATFLMLLSGKYKGELRHVDDYRESLHFLLDDQEERTFYKLPGRPETMKGISGCGVFKFKAKRDHKKHMLNIDGKSFRLIGIQHGWKDRKYFKVTKIGYALYLIYKVYGDLEDPLGFYVSSKKTKIVSLSQEWNPVSDSQ